MQWLLEQSTFERMEAAAATFEPRADLIEQFEARAMGGDGPRNLSISGGVARVEIVGVLTKRPDFLAWLFGGGNTTYRDIVAAVDRAAADETVKEIQLVIDSPGGSIDGLFDAIAALQSVKGKKTITALVDGLAASAAYALASQADRITANNYGARVGSVGIMAQFVLSDRSVSLTSTDAPDKAPDVRTETGRAKVIEHLDALHALFVEAIATGRGVTVEKVNTEFGRGGVVLAGEAVRRGMIDAVAVELKSIKPNQTARAAGKEIGNMDLDTLKAEHPGVYAAAVQEGITKERDRVAAHLIMGETTGAIDKAIKAVKEGAEMTQTLTAEYMAAGLNRKAADDRAADDRAAAAADTAAAAAVGGNAATASEQVADMVEARLGITK